MQNVNKTDTNHDDRQEGGEKSRNGTESRIAVLPLGACEYHGPHLPPETDTLIAKAIVKRSASMLAQPLDVRFLEVEPLGYSVEHMRAQGTKTLSWRKAIERWTDIGRQQYRNGIRKFVMLNAHGGNSPLMTIVATELRTRLNMLAVATGWTRFGLPPGLLSGEQQALDIHAGFIETSMMLAIAPERVDMRRAADFHNAQASMAREFTYLRAYGKHAFGWMMHDLNPEGAAGNAQRANAADGEKILAHAAQGFVRLLSDVHHFNPEYLA